MRDRGEMMARSDLERAWLDLDKERRKGNWEGKEGFI
jgi:hypothetical protein